MITIRSYQPADYSQVVTLLQEADLYADTWEAEENLTSMVVANPDSIIVAVDQNKIIGTIFLIPYGAKIAFLFRLAVKKEYRHQGIATQILNYVEDLAHKKGIIELCLFADEANKDLQVFYQKRGWTSSKHPYYCLWKEISNFIQHN